MTARKREMRPTIRRLVLQEGDIVVGDYSIVFRPVAGRDHIGRISQGDRGKGCSDGEEAQRLDETKGHHSRCV